MTKFTTKKIQLENGRFTRWDVPPTPPPSPPPPSSATPLLKKPKWDLTPVAEEAYFSPEYFKPSVMFHEYECRYFKKNIYCTLKSSHGLRRSKYGYEITDIKPEDMDEIDKNIQYYLPNVKITPEKWFVNNVKFRIFDEDNNFLDDIIDDRKWNICLEIIGIKVKSDEMKPMWRIVLAKQVKK